MLSMNGSRCGSRRLKDRLAWLLRPANSLLRSSCSSQSSTSTFTATSTSPSTTTSATAATATDLLPRVQPSSALGPLRSPQPEENKKRHGKTRSCASSRHAHARSRHFENADDRVMRKLSTNPYGFTTTDDDEDTHDSDDYMETEAFLSATSLVSSDSSGFYTSSNVLPKHPRGGHHHRQRPQQTKRRRRRRRRAASCVDSSSCSVRDEVQVGFRPVVTAEDELRKGLAVVRRSRDPYADFRESMVEMIVERQVFGAAELERLLRTYLSLNPTRLHPVILQAFSDIWVVLRGC
ncbi:unnamed protein product [Alopecurus aequalis]